MEKQYYMEGRFSRLEEGDHWRRRKVKVEKEARR